MTFPTVCARVRVRGVVCVYMWCGVVCVCVCVCVMVVGWFVYCKLHGHFIWLYTVHKYADREQLLLPANRVHMVRQCSSGVCTSVRSLCACLCVLP